MKLRKSTQIALGFAALVAALFFGYNLVAKVLIDNKQFPPLTPGDVNLIGISPRAGYHIIVANYMAQLVQSSDKFDAGDAGSDEGATDGAIKKRLPIKDLINTLRGDSKSLGALVMSLNDMSENDEKWPAIRVVWTATDIKRALDGDAKLASKLESDICMKLDGMPMDEVRPSSILNGIIIQTPVSVTVNLNGKQTVVTGNIQEPFKPRMVDGIYHTLQDKHLHSASDVGGYYRDAAQQLLAKPQTKEDVRASLLERISDSLAKQRAEPAERVLASAYVVVTDSLIKGAEYNKYEGSDGKPLFDITVHLSDEGRQRLWKYSRHETGSQLLLCANGIPIAAPMIQHELPLGTVDIRQMHDETLVKDAVAILNSPSKRSARL